MIEKLELNVIEAKFEHVVEGISIIKRDHTVESMKYIASKVNDLVDEVNRLTKKVEEIMPSVN